MWFGGRKAPAGPWMWFGKTTGEITAIEWDDSEPNVPETEHCLVSYKAGVAGSGKTHDAPCENAYAFACEMI